MKDYSNTVIIFDIDGTLINSSKKLENDTINTFSILGYEITSEESQIDWQILLKKYNIKWEDFDRALNKRKSWEESLKDGEVTLFQETKSVLEELKKRKVRLTALSLSIPEYTKAKLGFFDLLKYFEEVETINDSMGIDKNQGAVNIIKRMDYKKLERVYTVGDKLADVVCEKSIKDAFPNLKTQGVYVNRNGNSLKDYSDIKNLKEILEII